MGSVCIHLETRHWRLPIPVMALAVFLLPGCEPAPPVQQLGYSSAPPAGVVVSYRFAVHPLHNPALLMDAYQPLVDHLNRQLKGVQIVLEPSRNYQDFEAKYAARGPAFLLPNPWQTLQAIKVGYHVIAMAGKPDDFKGILLVRRDSAMREPRDLKGKAVSYPSYTALAACVMPQYFLHRNGVDVRRDLRNVFAGSQESAIMNVYLGETAAGAAWPPPWRLFQRLHPKEAAALKVMWETEPLINNAVMARDDVPPQVLEPVRQALLALAHHPAGKDVLAAMEIDNFSAATDTTYDVVSRYVAQFERDVRPVNQP